ncbi:MAG: hypothetical protein NTX45_04620 [Proteobacteria bacterium]|nr:hypothetical protein [Pseudomonadota bacterium]
MINPEIESLHSQIDGLVDKLDEPIYKTLNEIEAVINLVTLRLCDVNNPLSVGDTALLGKIMSDLDYSFSEYRHKTETPDIP